MADSFIPESAAGVATPCPTLLSRYSTIIPDAFTISA